MWATLADMLTFPAPSFLDALGTGELATRLTGLTAALPYELSFDRDALAPASDVLGLGSEYIRLFDLPVDGPPVPLYGGLYGGGRHQVMEELLRLYRHFGLSTQGASSQDLPDAIPTVLEFLAFLAEGEGRAGVRADARALRQAQGDLVERHLSRWCPGIVDRLGRREPHPFYRATVELLDRLVVAERAELGRSPALGRPVPGGADPAGPACRPTGPATPDGPVPELLRCPVGPPRRRR
jgi:DMSO reductase family type II enzyme chaperone